MNLVKDTLGQLLTESMAYEKFSDLEKMAQEGDLSSLPIQPLYFCLKSSSKEVIAQVLPRLSQDQRQSLLDIELWHKDQLDPISAMKWLPIYAECADEELQSQFAQSEEFLLSIKSRVNIWTFDPEDPQYPDHDYYFLTEDNQLLFEYDEDFEELPHLKSLISSLYSKLGVENAYAHLFKMISDSFSFMEEENYQRKKERLRDYGFVDYYEALAIESGFQSIEQIENYINKRPLKPGKLETEMKVQVLHAKVVTTYHNTLEGIKKELSEIGEEEVKRFLNFNFIRLVNARLSYENIYDLDTLSLGRVNQSTRQCLELGFDYIKCKEKFRLENTFSYFDFVDLYRVGKSLLAIIKKEIKNALQSSGFLQETEFFLGKRWNDFLDNTLSEPVKILSTDQKWVPLICANGLKSLQESSQTFRSLLPYIKTFHSSIEKLNEENLLQDEFYLNYSVDEIDFEAIILSSFINYTLGKLGSESPKMGVTIAELKKFYSEYFDKEDKEYEVKTISEIGPKINEFKEKFGMSNVKGIEKYVYSVIQDQMNGYEVDSLTDEDYAHIGGPIILTL